jgi:tetratricopeptide (TPR) repeat protein
LPLSDEDKDNIKVVVKEAISGQQPASAASDLEKTKLQYKADINELLAKNQELVGKMQESLHELQLYKWAIRGIILLVLGGSVLTILKYKEVIDAQIMVRMAKSDRLNLAIQLGSQGQWREALMTLDEIWVDIRKSPDAVNSQYKSFFFRNFLWVISQTEERRPDGSFVGAEEWKQLNADPDFRAEFITSPRWDNDPAINDNLAFAFLKFEGSTTVARKYFQVALNSSHPDIRKAPNYFALAMVDLIDNEPEKAIAGFQQAGRLDPSSYSIEDAGKYANSFMNSTEFTIWEAVAEQKGQKNFRALYADVANRLSTANGAAAHRKTAN